MNGFATIIKEFGLAVGLIVILLGFCWYLVNKFIKSMNEATQERKEMTVKYNDMVANHINHSTETQRELIQGIRELRVEIHDSFKESANDHKRILEELR